MISLKKQLMGIAALVCGMAVLAFPACGQSQGGDSTSDSQSDSAAPVITQKIELAEYFQDATGSVSVTIGARAEIKTSASVSNGTVVGSETLQQLVVDGGESKQTLRATGSGLGAIKAGGSGTLVFRNLKVEDYSIDASDFGRRGGYLEWGGNVRFENCEFNCSLYLTENANVTFENCVFSAEESQMYSVWVDDGSAAFTNCSFTGYRAIKIHEEGASDVISVTIDGCQFKDIAEKPGVAIGSMIADPMQTTVTIKNSTFENCGDWSGASSGCVEGINGFYESDTPSNRFNFVFTDNIIDGYPQAEFDIEYTPQQPE